MPKRKKRQNVPYHRKRRGTGKSKLDKGQTEIHALTPDIAHDEDLLPSETEELTCTSVDSVSLDHSYLSDNQTVAELCLDEEIDVNQHIELECQEECVIALEDPYEALKKTVCTSLTSPYVYNSASSDHLQIIEHYPSSKSVYVKLTIIINKDFSAKLYVHGIELSREHDIWLGLPSVYDNITSIERLLSKLKSYTVCSGNHEQEFLDLTPVGSTIEHATDAQSCRGFKEQDFGAVKGTINYSSTVRNVSCLLLVQGNRCSPCTRLCRILISILVFYCL